jgi:hypothetical protein
MFLVQFTDTFPLFLPGSKKIEMKRAWCLSIPSIRVSPVVVDFASKPG